MRSALPILVLSACVGCKPTTAPAAPASGSTAEAEPTTASEPTTAAPEPEPEEPKVASNTPSLDRIPECDAYAKQYRACVTTKVPEASRDATLQAFDQSLVAWEQVASSEDGMTTLAEVCREAYEKAAAATHSFGCAWPPLP